MADTDDKTFTIQGVKVLFPCKPYPSQFSMMDRVIKGLERRQNCLLESPTGSGKSLALLCSALAWQFAENEDGCSKCNDSDIQQIDDDSKNVEMTSCTVALNPNKSKAEIVPGLDVNDDDDFKPFSIIRSSLSQVMKVLKRTYQSISYETSPKAASLGFHGDSDMTDIKSSTCHCSCKDSGSSGQKRKVPKIFYGTRTHKQITQIAKELGKTAYREVRMVILASREHTCINPDVACMKSKSEGCKERIDIRGLGCKFKDKSQRVLVNQSQLQEAGLNTAWDLEDLVKIGRKHKACPYFVLRNVLSQADIILCPYNYLIDPTIRKSMEINLKDNVIILDEAHNIEDAAREAASESILLDDLTQAIQNLNDLVENHISFPEHLELKSMCERLQHFLEENSSHLEQNDYNQAYRCWSGFDIVARLTSIQLGPNDFLRYQKLYDKLLSEEQNETLIRNQKNQMVRRSNGTSQLLERLFKVLDYMYRDDMKFVDDYRVALQKSVTYASSHDTDSTWLTSRQKHGGRKTSPSWQFSINFWCMNPAVAFSDLSVTRNVILSSGTLSPMNSFQSELGVPFPVHLEANHIIESDRVWVGAVGQGPTGRSLQAVYKTMESFDFQDELGNLIHKVCMNVPHGVLCFVPSYRALEKFTGRWRNTGLWGKLLQRKRVVVEPRASEKVDFEECMKYFYDSVLGDAADNGEEVDTSEVDGALFFAVCRGKVSEGLDFADNNARAVITVGIPYPSIKDNQVKLKKEYNDKHKASRGLLSGNEWYEIQAYRALNQALGRCIRHRKDWGALIIVDERFVVNREKYCKGLSKWVRNKVQSYNKFESAMESLSEFTAKFAKETRICADTSFIPPSPSTPKYSVYQSKNNSFKSPSLTSPTLKLDEKQFLPQSPVIPPSIPFQITNGVRTPPTIPSEIKHSITTQPATQFELKNGVTTPPTIPSEIKKRLSTPPTNPFEIETGADKSYTTADSSTSTSSPMASLLQTLPWKPALSTCSNSALGTDVINMTSKDSTEKTGTNNAQNNQANTAGKSWEKIDKIKSSGFDPYVTENKFLKFCNIVKKEKPEENSSGPILNLQKTSKTEPEGRSVAPVLLKGNIEKLKIEKGKFDKMKRPLFRRRIIKMESDISYKDSSCEISEMKIDGSVSLKDENKPAIENCVFDIKEKVECGNQFEMEANDRKGTTKNQEIGKGDTREMINNILEKDNMHPNMSDEEVIDNVLNTRRRRGKRTSSLVKHNAKKSRVRYIEENSSKGDEGKETQVHNLSCSSCGSSFLAVSALVKTRDVPKFWTERCGSELIQIENLDPQSSFEVAVADPQASVTLNCLWCADLQCGVQFLKCSTCRKTNKGGNPTGIIGARILFTSEGCKDFAQGQTWLLSSAVKTTLD